MDFIYYPDKLLTTPSEKVENISDILPYLAEMRDIVKKPTVAGLSAVQIGVPLRFFFMKFATPLKAGSFDISEELVINPYILKFSKTTQSDFEGCLSFPYLRVPVERSLEVLVSYKTCDLDGNNERTKETTLTRFNARVFQHEFEHLEGKTFFDNLKPIKKGLYSDRYKKILKNMKRNTAHG